MNKTDCHNCGQIHHICGQIYKQTNLVSGFFPTDTLYVCVAPMLLATSSLLSMMSVITTSEAPMALAVRRLTRPIGPAPQIKTLLPRETPARLETSRMLVWSDHEHEHSPQITCMHGHPQRGAPWGPPPPGSCFQAACSKSQQHGHNTSVGFHEWEGWHKTSCSHRGCTRLSCRSCTYGRVPLALLPLCLQPLLMLINRNATMSKISILPSNCSHWIQPLQPHQQPRDQESLEPSR